MAEIKTNLIGLNSFNKKEKQLETDKISNYKLLTLYTERNLEIWDNKLLLQSVTPYKRKTVFFDNLIKAAV